MVSQFLVSERYVPPALHNSWISSLAVLCMDQVHVTAYPQQNEEDMQMPMAAEEDVV